MLLGDDAAVDDYIFLGGVELGDAAGDLGADELFHLGDFARAGARSGHEGADADVDGEAALDDGGDGTDDRRLVGEGFFERGPVDGLDHFVAGEFVVALGVATLDGDGEGVAGVDGLGVVFEGGAREDAFGFVADVEVDGFGVERDDGALELGVGALGFVRVRVLEFG